MKNNYIGPPNPTGCQHIAYNIGLIKAGVHEIAADGTKIYIRTYAQAMAKVRTFICPCSKCHPLRRYAQDMDASLNSSMHRNSEIRRLQLKQQGLN